jgi:hypothetical protein
MKYFIITLLFAVSQLTAASELTYYPVTSKSTSGSNPNVEVNFAAFKRNSELDFFEYRCVIYPAGYPGWTDIIIASKEYLKKRTCSYRSFFQANESYIMEIQLVYYPNTSFEKLFAKTQKFILYTGSNSTEINPAKVIYLN